ncbi:hypothetical protein CANCADRAFT_32644 [Tortispora caseinolytica NRRL Y-17796]|uniref:Uncharacterized protein n=1 Tax=Tortispora caseinolytica NRRL Y-17796 TaxID=767744 RepID=A0A1E4TC66_9ASCO|nr:hypothetical protein CANCADRAFT_32644 [Tortispora caseinolytica NRRL Y-17796]
MRRPLSILRSSYRRYSQAVEPCGASEAVRSPADGKDAISSPEERKLMFEQRIQKRNYLARVYLHAISLDSRLHPFFQDSGMMQLMQNASSSKEQAMDSFWLNRLRKQRTTLKFAPKLLPFRPFQELFLGINTKVPQIYIYNRSLFDLHSVHDQPPLPVHPAFPIHSDSIMFSSLKAPNYVRRAIAIDIFDAAEKQLKAADTPGDQLNAIRTVLQFCKPFNSTHKTLLSKRCLKYIEELDSPLEWKASDITVFLTALLHRCFWTNQVAAVSAIISTAAIRRFHLNGPEKDPIVLPLNEACSILGLFLQLVADSSNLQQNYTIKKIIKTVKKFHKQRKETSLISYIASSYSNALLTVGSVSDALAVSHVANVAGYSLTPKALTRITMKYLTDIRLLKVRLTKVNGSKKLNVRKFKPVQAYKAGHVPEPSVSNSSQAVELRANALGSLLPLRRFLTSENCSAVVYLAILRSLDHSFPEIDYLTSTALNRIKTFTIRSVASNRALLLYESAVDQYVRRGFLELLASFPEERYNKERIYPSGRLAEAFANDNSLHRALSSILALQKRILALHLLSETAQLRMKMICAKALAKLGASNVLEQLLMDVKLSGSPDAAELREMLVSLRHRNYKKIDVLEYMRNNLYGVEERYLLEHVSMSLGEDIAEQERARFKSELRRGIAYSNFAHLELVTSDIMKNHVRRILRRNINSSISHEYLKTVAQLSNGSDAVLSEWENTVLPIVIDSKSEIKAECAAVVAEALVKDKGGGKATLHRRCNVAVDLAKKYWRWKDLDREMHSTMLMEKLIPHIQDSKSMRVIYEEFMTASISDSDILEMFGDSHPEIREAILSKRRGDDMNKAIEALETTLCV